MFRFVQTIIVLYLVSSSFSAMALDFPLPQKNFVPAKMPMHLVYPRPDSETQAHARHRWAHPDFRYEIPIGVQGGAWPFKYEVVQGPNGASVGAYYGDANYGIVTWTPTESNGTESFTIRVTDQELNTLEISWSVTVDSDQFVFIQDGYSGPKVGTISQPLESFADWYKADLSDATYKNKIVVFRGGKYSAYGSVASNGNVKFDSTAKTPSLIGFPDETPIIDCSLAKFFYSINFDDIFVAGIRFENGRQDVANAHFFWITAASDRVTFWNNYFYNLGPGTTGIDNTSTVFISDTGTLKDNFLYKGNTVENIHNSGYNGSYVEAYTTSHVLFEENIAKNSDSNAGFFPKATVAYVTVRANQAYENVSGSQLGVGYDWTGGYVPHDTEICWNRVVIKPGNSSQLLMMWAHGEGFSGQTYNSFIYRNTFVNGSSWVRFPGKELFETDGNVVVSDLLNRWELDSMKSVIPNLTGAESAGITDSSGLLKGHYRSLYLGIRGHELSSEYVTTPKAVDLTVK
jgi:hypothetical protein